MKMIEFQKEPRIIDSIYVIVNGDKHLMRHQSLKVQVVDGKPFEVRVKQTWDGSPVYKFEPKDEMVLQISQNRQLMRWCRIFSIAAMAVAFVIHFVLLNSLTSVIFAGVILFSPMIYFIIRRKKIFIIQKTEKDESSNDR